MTGHLTRRHFVGGLIGAGGLTILPGCQSMPGFSLVAAIRELLTLSSQSAFARLLQPGGFYDSEISRISLPGALRGGSGLLATILGSSGVRVELQKLLNDVAEDGAERAAPIVTRAITSMSITDAAAIVNGGPTAATNYLRSAMNVSLLDLMVPEIGSSLQLLDNNLVKQAVNAATGYDFSSLTRDLSAGAEEAIWRSIGAEEADIRANPNRTNNPVLMAVFGFR